MLQHSDDLADALLVLYHVLILGRVWSGRISTALRPITTALCVHLL